MVSSFIVSVSWFIYNKHGGTIPGSIELLATVGITTVCWITAAFTTPQTDLKKLVDFYLKVRPAGPGWEPVRRAAAISKTDARNAGDNMPMALLGWVAGCTVIWSSLFTVGNFLYGRMTTAVVLLIVSVASGSALIYVVNRLWTKKETPTPIPDQGPPDRLVVQ